MTEKEQIEADRKFRLATRKPNIKFRSTVGLVKPDGRRFNVLTLSEQGSGKVLVSLPAQRT